MTRADTDTDLLIIGAGPFGLAMARYARVHDIEHVIVGRPMAFWRENMPQGMMLRSGIQWHLDPEGELTFRHFLRVRGLAPEDLQPLPIDVYLDYASWFERSAENVVRHDTVATLERDEAGRFRARLGSGDMVSAARVLLAVGFHAFVHIDPDLEELLPDGRYGHTRDFVQLDRLRDKGCVIIGGRQSAFEWAALLADAGAAAVHVVHRHATPTFAASDWSWVPDLLAATEADPSWYRSLSPDERQAIERRFWEEGRLKLEPWLVPRLDETIVRAWPHDQVVGCAEHDDGSLGVQLQSGAELVVDQILLATGYEVDMARVSFLSAEIRAAMELREGWPCLDESFQTSVPGLYVTSMPAARDFGPFMGFTVAVPATTRIIGRALTATAAPRPSTTAGP